MRKYFRNIVKPRWYVLIISVLLYILQCSALIPACRELGGEYYAIIPIQLVVGLLDIMFYLIVQKERWSKTQITFQIASIILGAIIVKLVLSSPFTLAEGIVGVLYGVVLYLTNALVIYVLINSIKSLVVKHNEELIVEKPDSESNIVVDT